jgi:hypothetical protein
MGTTYNNFGTHNGPVGDGASMGDINFSTNDLEAISKLISEIMAVRSEIIEALPPDKAGAFNSAIEVIQSHATAPQKNWGKLKQGAEAAKNILMSSGDVVAKWIPLFEKMYDAALKTGLI